jgi:hypothetical protein
MWEDVYIKPYCRGAPWIVGIVLGYIFFKYKKVKLNYVSLIILKNKNLVSLFLYFNTLS